MIFQGAELDEEEEDRMRKIELLKCVEEWENHVLAKSQSGDMTTTHTSTQNKTIRAAVASSDNSSSDNNKSSKHGFNKASDPQKKHCDEPRKVTQSDYNSLKHIASYP